MAHKNGSKCRSFNRNSKFKKQVYVTTDKEIWETQGLFIQTNKANKITGHTHWETIKGNQSENKLQKYVSSSSG